VVEQIIGTKSQAQAAVRALPAVRRIVIDEGSAGQRLDNFLLRELKGVPKTHVYRVIRSGEVRINKGRAAADTRLALGDEVRVPPVRTAEPKPESAAPAREFAVLFEDEQLLAIDKPAGVAVHGGSGVSFGVIEQLRRARPRAAFLELVHRLDKETSGVLLLAKRRSALTGLQDQFRERGTEKIYAALVNGVWPANKKVIDVALVKTLDAKGERHVRAVRDDGLRQAQDDRGGGPAQDDRGLRQAQDARRSITLVKVARAFAAQTLLEVTLKTGRTHQIRVHLAHEGHAIVGDPKYGDFAANRQMARGEHRFARMFLHARRLAFDHPASGERIMVQAPLPSDCTQLLEQL
jgi:23S rRNA pseudouridine955/2504/2580 synthase